MSPLIPPSLSSCNHNSIHSPIHSFVRSSIFIHSLINFDLHSPLCSFFNPGLPSLAPFFFFFLLLLCSEDKEATSACFSEDGSWLAVSYNLGMIEVRYPSILECGLKISYAFQFVSICDCVYIVSSTQKIQLSCHNFAYAPFKMSPTLIEMYQLFGSQKKIYGVGVHDQAIW